MMKTNNKWFQVLRIFCSFALLFALASCEKGADERPGLWVDTDIIYTVPGGTVTINGQASCYVGIQSINASCVAWGINENIYPSNEKVCDFTFTINIPADAVFDQNLVITVTDKNGSEQKVTLRMVYSPDNNGLKADVQKAYEVTWDGTKGVYDMAFKVEAASIIQKAVVTILNPDESTFYSKEFAVNASSATLTDNPLTFYSKGTYTTTIILYDIMGNSSVTTTKLIVTEPEVDYGYEGVTALYLIRCDASGNIEDPDNYAYGYYRYLDPDSENAYSFSLYPDGDTPRSFYAKAGEKFYFVSEQNVVPGKTDFNLFGESPVIEGKILNNNGYVKPITIEEEGYYNLWVSLPEHSIKMEKASTANAYSGDMLLAGNGLNADYPTSWDPQYMMVKESTYRYTTDGEITISSDAAAYNMFFFKSSGWTWDWSNDQFRGNDKWWWIATGGGVASINPGNATKLTIIFDTAEMWAVAKKPTEKSPDSTNDKLPSGPQL